MIEIRIIGTKEEIRHAAECMTDFYIIIYQNKLYPAKITGKYRCYFRLQQKEE